jgi:hypothetical protein
MWWLRYFLIPPFICSILLLTGTLKSHPPQTSPSPPVLPPGPAIADPAATQLLDQAAEKFKPERTAWVRANLWQQVACEDFSYQAEGRYLSGPDQRLHLDLKVRVGKTRGAMKVVSDGKTLLQRMQVAGQAPTEKRIEVRKGLLALASSDMSPAMRIRLHGQQCVGGLAPLLQGLSTRMTATRRELISWRGHEVVRLTLVWPEEVAKELVPAGTPWPANLARQCLLYLDSVSLWPHRLEWWGPGAQGQHDIQLLQMEFRDPVLNQPLTAEQCRREFTVEPLVTR